MKSRRWLVVAGAVLFSPLPAAAQTPVETALRDMVAELDATPEWAATISSISYDAASDTATVRGFSARTERPGTEIGVATIAVTGFSTAPDGSITVKSATADGGVLKAGPVSVDINDVGIEDLFVPVLGDLVFDSRKPFTSIIQTYREALKVRFARARAGSIVFVQNVDGTDSKVTYDHLRMDGFTDGKLESLRAGPLRMESPSPQGLVITTIGSVESHDTDLAAFVRVYDPDAYQDGVGDMVWHDGIGLAAYYDIQVDVPGANVVVDSITAEDMRVRQPPTPFAIFFDSVMNNPVMSDSRMERLFKRYGPGLMGAWSIGRFSMSGLVVDAQGIDHFAMGDMTFKDFSIDGLGEFAIEDLGVAVRGEGAMKLGRFAFGDMAFGGIEGLERLIEAANQDKDVDPSEFVPNLGFFELAKLEVQTTEIEHLSLERFAIKASDYIGMVPTSSTLELVSLVLPTSAVTERETRQFLERFGYEKVDFSAFADIAWQEAGETLSIRDMRFDLADMGSLAMKSVLEGFPLAALGDERALQAAVANIKLVEGEVTFKDESIVGAGLAIAAEQFGFNVPVEQFRKQFAGAIPFLFSIASAADPQMAAIVRQSGLLGELTPAVAELVAAEGGSITFKLDPPSPIPLPALSTAIENAPDTLVSILGLSVTGQAGAMPEPVEPPAPAPAPAEPPPVAPANDNSGAERPAQQPAN